MDDKEQIKHLTEENKRITDLLLSHTHWMAKLAKMTFEVNGYQRDEEEIVKALLNNQEKLDTAVRNEKAKEREILATFEILKTAGVGPGGTLVDWANQAAAYIAYLKDEIKRAKEVNDQLKNSPMDTNRWASGKKEPGNELYGTTHIVASKGPVGLCPLLVKIGLAKNETEAIGLLMGRGVSVNGVRPTGNIEVHFGEHYIVTGSSTRLPTRVVLCRPDDAVEIAEVNKEEGVEKVVTCCKCWALVDDKNFEKHNKAHPPNGT
jgi:hypothetical protein